MTPCRGSKGYAMTQTLGWQRPPAHAKQDDGGSANPDPTMQHAKGSPKGENMPPKGGESISPANSTLPSRPNESGAVSADEDADDKAKPAG